MPCFWLHPCNTAEAMQDIVGGLKGESDSIGYLMIWFGLVGTAVGLSLSKDIAK